MKKIIIWLVTTLFLISCNQVTPNSDPNIDLSNISKKTYIWFVATWCPHCQEEVPVLDEFYRDHKSEVNMQLLVSDGKKFSWDYIIPQDTNSSITYEQLTWEACEYVPSYVIYDENKNITSKQCGAKLSYEDLENLLLDSNWTWTTMNSNNDYQLAWLTDWDLVATLTTTNWKIKIKLFPEDAPKTVTNFVWLAKTWYYSWTTFHRVIDWFMIQWWDPEGTWMWWESIYGWEFEDEFSDKLSNLTWALSMANAWANTNWSQFFINQVSNTSLDWRHTVFGQVVEWMDNVDKIAWVKVDENDKPEKDVKLISVEINKYESWSLVNYDFNLEDEINKINAEKEAKLEADKNREVKAWDQIKVNYILTLADTWEEFDNSYTRWQPLEFEVWAWTMIKWFDEWVRWMKIWEKKTLNISAADAYGEYSEANIQEVPRDQLKQLEDNWFEIKTWNKIPTPYGEFPILEVTDENVKVDLNPQLAWKDLVFEVEVVEFVN